MLGPEDVGHRVVVRRIVGIRDNRPVFSDTLGHLLTADEQQLTVQTAAGTVRVPIELITRAKRVPAQRRPSAADIAAVERSGALAWPAPDTGHVGEWLLRAAEGWTGRANSALPVGDPGRSLSAAIDEVCIWYAARRLPARINVPLPLAAQLVGAATSQRFQTDAVDAALDERGWSRSPVTLVQTAPVADLVSADPGLDVVVLEEAPAADWLAMATSRKGGLPPSALRVLTGPDLVRFAAVRDRAGTLLAAARGAVAAHRLHLGLVEVAPAARRRGLAQQVTRKLALWAASLPPETAAHTAFLQVEEHNAGARALYERLSFTTHHTYVTRTGR